MPKARPLIPARRTRYLAEIAETVRAYHAQGDETAERAREAASLAQALTVLGDPPPARAQPFGADAPGERGELRSRRRRSSSSALA